MATGTVADGFAMPAPRGGEADETQVQQSLASPVRPQSARFAAPRPPTPAMGLLGHFPAAKPTRPRLIKPRRPPLIRPRNHGPRKPRGPKNPRTDLLPLAARVRVVQAEDRDECNELCRCGGNRGVISLDCRHGYCRFP